MQVGETYRVADAPYLGWTHRNRVITHIDISINVVTYRIDGERETQLYSAQGVEEAIKRKDWILLYPSRIALPQGV